MTSPAASGGEDETGNFCYHTLNMSLRNFLLITVPTLGLLAAGPLHAATLTPGDLIKASGPSVYFFAENGKRYVFPTEKTFLTWYTDFSSVKTITDAELGAIMIGGNATYRPGTRLVKITTDPKVYAVGPGNALRWIKTEALAAEVFGADWAKMIDDISDAFFINYSIGDTIASASDYAAESVKSAHPTLQSVIAPPAQVTTPETPAQPAAPAVQGGIVLSLSKPTARAGDVETLTSYASHTASIQKIELFFDNQLIQTCTFSPCSVGHTIPTSGTKNSYEAKAIAYALDQTTQTATATIMITTDADDLVKLTLGRASIRPGQAGEAVVDVDASIAVYRTEISVGAIVYKSCGIGLRQCRWTGFLTGGEGATFDVYGIVTDTIGRTYHTAHKTITIASNDSPVIIVSPAKSLIYKGETLDVTVTANDDDGISKIEILSNGAIIKTCEGAAPCKVTTGPWNEAGTLTFNGRATDSLGFTAISDDVKVTVQ